MWLPSIEDAPKEQRENPSKWKKLNPDYEIKLWTYGEIHKLISDHYADFLGIWEQLYKPVKQADLARFFICHRHGGIYLDMDLIPLRSLDEWFEDGCIYNRCHTPGVPFPDVPSEHYCNLKSFKSILSKEHRRIDTFGVGIANGIICTEPGQDWIMDFLHQQKNAWRGKVLDYVGTWALTRYLRKEHEKLNEAGILQLMPPHYFLWELDSLGEPLDYAISTHDPGLSAWYDTKKKGGWKI